MKRCTRCILPDTYPGIHFDEDGICTRCKEWDVQFKAVDYPALKLKLDLLIESKKEEAKERGCPYDVIVPISGGKDSAYVLYIMKEIYDCSVLAINFYNGFQSEQAYRNIMHLINVFDVDFKMVSIRPGLLKKAYRVSIERLNEFCLVCNCTGYWVIFNTLAIQFAPWGYQPLTVGGWSKIFEFDPQINTLDIHRYYDLLKETALLPQFCQTLDKKLLESLLQGDDIRSKDNNAYIQLPDFLPWDQSEILSTLVNHGWWPEADTDTHFDCWASPIADWIEMKKYGLNQKTTIQSAYVRAGTCSRKDALAAEQNAIDTPLDETLAASFKTAVGIDVRNLKK